MAFFKRFIDLVLYSNFFIAVCAVAMTLQTQFLLQGFIELSPIVVLIFCATLAVYALHRLIGLAKAKDFLGEGRYFIANKFKSHILVYAIIGMLVGVYYIFQISALLQIAIILPAFFSLGYVLPVFGKEKKMRLRDYSGLKIFLIAVIWAYVTVLLPALEIGVCNAQVGWMLLERGLFIFAMALPFDIRDLKIDGHNTVQTIPAWIGIPKTIQLAGCLLGLFALIAFFTYSIMVFLALLMSAISTFYLIYLSPKQGHDYFFAALMDGTMIIQFVLVLMAGV
jgi:hypothetical protein